MQCNQIVIGLERQECRVHFVGYCRPDALWTVTVATQHTRGSAFYVIPSGTHSGVVCECSWGSNRECQEVLQELRNLLREHVESCRSSRQKNSGTQAFAVPAVESFAYQESLPRLRKCAPFASTRPQPIAITMSASLHRTARISGSIKSWHDRAHRPKVSVQSSSFDFGERGSAVALFRPISTTEPSFGPQTRASANCLWSSSMRRYIARWTSTVSL
jgi:hypothetical protein